MTALSEFRFPRIAAALVLVAAAGCQGPGGSGGRTPEWVGTLPRHDTDFDRRTWQDTSVSTVQPLMEHLPDRIESAAQHRLARNLLVSITDAPQGGDDSGEVLAVRVNELIQLGSVADAAALARASRNPPRDQAAAEREVEAELLAGNVEMACIDLHALAAQWSPQWGKEGLALCDARAGEPGAATPSKSEKLGAFARIGGAALPAEPPSGDAIVVRTAYLAAVGSDPKVPASRRLEAAFIAARASALSGEAYAKILRAVHGQGALAEGPPSSGEQAASLFHAIEGTADPERKLALAERGLLSPDGAVDGVSAAMAEALRAVKPEAGAIAGRFAAYFYAVGDIKAATSWSDLAKRSGADTAVWPYRAVLDPPSVSGLAQWGKRAHLDAAAMERITAILSAFGGAGAGQASSQPGRDDLRSLAKAATQLHVGETTLRALAILGREGPAGAEPQTLHGVLAALDRVSLHDEARAIAFEAIAATLSRGRHPHKGEVDAAGAPFRSDKSG